MVTDYFLERAKLSRVIIEDMFPYVKLTQHDWMNIFKDINNCPFPLRNSFQDSSLLITFSTYYAIAAVKKQRL